MKNLNPPWNTAVERNGDVTVAAMDGGAVVAVVRKDDVPDYEARQSLAHLFAAAPDMYEAMQDLIDDHNKKAQEYGEDVYCYCPQCVKLIHVLEKARGEKPHAPKLEI